MNLSDELNNFYIDRLLDLKSGEVIKTARTVALIIIGVIGAILLVSFLIILLFKTLPPWLIILILVVGVPTAIGTSLAIGDVKIDKKYHSLNEARVKKIKELEAKKK